jgi:hypothetical protein
MTDSDANVNRRATVVSRITVMPMAAAAMRPRGF